MTETPDSFPNLHVVNHPLVLHKLSEMRDVACQTADFRRLLKEISLLMGYEVTRTLETETRQIKTPLCEMNAPVLSGGRFPVIVPILRAGLGMADGLETLMPESPVGHIGVYRDEKTHKPVEYLVRLPKSCKDRLHILVDPMLATGYSALHGVDVLIREGVSAEQIVLMVLVSAPEGVKTFHEKYPSVPVFTAVLDEKLNDRAYIVPGLGDAGDRLFGTE